MSWGLGCHARESGAGSVVLPPARRWSVRQYLTVISPRSSSLTSAVSSLSKDIVSSFVRSSDTGIVGVSALCGIGVAAERLREGRSESEEIERQHHPARTMLVG
jgi:hypothetical protein